jgi:hypothetical protein
MKLTEKVVDSLKFIRNRSPAKYQISNIFESAKNINELIELQVMLNNRYTGYY